MWQLRGKYPNRGYPKIFKDETVGEEAKKLHADALRLLDEVVAKKTLKATGVAGIWPANSVGDDIEVRRLELAICRATRRRRRRRRLPSAVLHAQPADQETGPGAPRLHVHIILHSYTPTPHLRLQVFAADGSGASLGVFHTLRQQEEREDATYFALSDFVAPKESGVRDYVGAFAVSAGFGCDAVCKQLRAEHDDYQGIMIEAIADRLAEAFAEMLHHQMRTQLWGYAAGEELSVDDMLKTKYQGIRPAPGYPTQPDHTEKSLMWKLLDAEKAAGIELTDSLAMLPAASVSALVFANPCATYFQAGKLCKDQVSDYAARKGMSVDEAEKWLGPYLGYDNSK